jgi:hypothetical protein
MKRRDLVGAISASLIVLGATVGVAWLAIFGGVAAPLPVGDGTPATATPAQPAADVPAGADQLSCASSSLASPAPGRWELYRAEYGSRGDHDYLRLKLREDGATDGTAHVVAELLAPAEVSERYGLAPPGPSDLALVVGFDGPVHIPGAFGGRGRGALREFTISQAGDAVFVVAAIDGSGCFSLVADGWDTEQPGRQVDIVIEIERG